MKVATPRSIDTEDISDRWRTPQKLYARERKLKGIASLPLANEEIGALNEILQSENLRISAELDITRPLQQKILPAKSVLSDGIG